MERKVWVVTTVLMVRINNNTIGSPCYFSSVNKTNCLFVYSCVIPLKSKNRNWSFNITRDGKLIEVKEYYFEITLAATKRKKNKNNKRFSHSEENNFSI